MDERDSHGEEINQFQVDQNAINPESARRLVL
jgi:hypothetical protein